MGQLPAIPLTSPSDPAQASSKKGVPAIAWVGIGCGGLIILATIVGGIIFSKVKNKFDEIVKNPEKAAAEWVVSRNPDLKMVSQDQEAGKMTIRTKDGKELTLSYQDISEGRITMTDSDGNMTRIGSSDLSQVPGWVPKPKDFSDPFSTFQSVAGGEITGLFSLKTSLGTDDLQRFYEDASTALKMPTSSSKSMNANGTCVTTLNHSGGGRSLRVMITEKSGVATQVNTNYSEK
jgi:hypothetical protein